MIQKPYAISIENTVIDANNPISVSWKTSGDTSASFSISVYKNSDNSLVWSLPRTYSFALSYTIPAGAIPNENDYKIAITVWNSTEESATSNAVIFTTSTTPVVTVAPINTINNHTNLFTATYSQSESDPLSTYIVNLYNADQTLWKTSGTLTDGLLEYRFDLLKNEMNYYIEFIVTSKKGLSASSGLIEFNVMYDNPSMYFELTADSIPETASISLKWKIRQVIGKTDIQPIYLNSEELDIREGKLFYDEGFEVDRDFTLKIWFREIIQDIDLINLNGGNGNIRLVYEKDGKFHLYKTVNNFITHYSYQININNGYFVSPYQYVEGVGYKVYLCIIQKNGKIDLYSEIIN